MKKRLLCVLLSMVMLASLMMSPVFASAKATGLHPDITIEEIETGVYTVTKAVDENKLGMWQLKGSAAEVSGSIHWYMDGFDSFDEYLIDLVNTANLVASHTIAVDGLKDLDSAHIVEEWLATAVVFLQDKLCSDGHKHTEMIGEYEAPGCLTTGLTEGLRCQDCGTVIYPRQSIPATGHRWNQRDICDICGASRAESEIPSYSITILSFEHGSAVADARYAYEGTLINITPKADSGFIVSSVSVKADSGKSVPVTENRDGTFSFSLPAENVTVMITCSAFHSIAIESVEHGVTTTSVRLANTHAKVIVTATPEEGYMVERISVRADSGVIVPCWREAEDKYAFYMPDSDVTVTPVFTVIRMYNVYNESSENGRTEISASAARAGATITVTPHPNPDFEVDVVYVSTDNGTGVIVTRNDDGIYRFIMPSSNVKVSVVYKAVKDPDREYSITVANPVNGSVVVSAAKARVGTMVSVKAEANPGYSIRSVAIESASREDVPVYVDKDLYSFEMPDDDVLVVVTFDPVTYSVRVTSGINGAVKAEPIEAVAGTTISLAVQPDPGFDVGSVKVIGAESHKEITIHGNRSPYNFDMPTEDVIVTATFRTQTETRPANHSITVMDGGHGVTYADHAEAAAGAAIIVTVEPELGYTASKVEVNSYSSHTIAVTEMGNDTYKFTMPDDDVTITVDYEAIQYHITTSATSYGSIKVDRSVAIVGDRITVKAEALSGYDLERMAVETHHGDVVQVIKISEKEFSFAMPADDVTITGIFRLVEKSPTSYQISVADTEHGTLRAYYESSAAGSVIRIVANPDSGYAVKSVYVNAEDNLPIHIVSGSDNSFSFVMPACDVTVSASFAPRFGVEHSISVMTGTHGSARTDYSSALEGTPITLAVSPDLGYEAADIVVIDGNGHSVTVSAAGVNTYTFTMTASDVVIKISFRVKSELRYNVVVSRTTHGSVTTSVNKARGGELVTVKASPAYGYRLDYISVRADANIPIKVAALGDDRYQFVMPECDVTIYTEFGQLSNAIGPDVPVYSVWIAETPYGAVTADRSWANPGTWVTVRAWGYKGYHLAGLVVCDIYGNRLYLEPNSNGTFSFMLPSCDVSVVGTFEADAITPPTAFPGESAYQLPFSDMSQNSWYYEDVLYLYQRGIMKGISGTQFGGGYQTSRAQLVTMLYRLAGEPDVFGIPPFSDVPLGQYFTNAVKWASDNRIVSGYGNNVFGPGGSITREQLITLVYRYAASLGYDVTVTRADKLLSFKDAGKVSDFAVDAMAWACENRLMEGSSEGMLNPREAATRADIAVTFHRFCEAFK